MLRFTLSVDIAQRLVPGVVINASLQKIGDDEDDSILGNKLRQEVLRRHRR